MRWWLNCSSRSFQRTIIPPKHSKSIILYLLIPNYIINQPSFKPKKTKQNKNSNAFVSSLAPLHWLVLSNRVHWPVPQDVNKLLLVLDPSVSVTGLQVSLNVSSICPATFEEPWERTLSTVTWAPTARHVVCILLQNRWSLVTRTRTSMSLTVAKTCWSWFGCNYKWEQHSGFSVTAHRLD